jgi:GpE protein
LPRRVEDAMADMAAVFHWPLSEMSGMSLAELLSWRERARLRVEQDER